MLQRSFLTVLLCAGLTPLAWSAPAFEAADTVATRFEELRGQMPKPPAPNFTPAFSPVSAVTTFKAPAGDHGQTVAYKTQSGCVFFAAPGVKAASWKGRGDCHGKPLEGDGRLALKRGTEDKSTIVHLMEGRFSAGMLTGPALKYNFIYTDKGRLDRSIRLKGEFANSVLHGDGERLEFFHAEDARPRAVASRARMVDGSPMGPGQFEREAPAPAVLADSYEVEFLPDDALSLARPIPGLMIVENWDTPLAVNVLSWDRTLPESVRFQFMTEQDSWIIGGHCRDLTSHAKGLQCRDGSITLMSQAFSATSVSDAWEIPALPEDERKLGLIFGNRTFFVGDSRYYLNMHCTPGEDICKGVGALPVAEGIYWWGDYSYEHGDGIVALNGAKLYELRGKKAAPESDLLRASCEVFESPTSCKQGRLLIGDVWFNGAWSLAGSMFVRGDSGAGEAYYQPRQGTFGETYAFHLSPVGAGRARYPSGAWADVSFDDNGRLDSVGRCDHPDGDATCHLQNHRLQFNVERRQQQATQPTRTVYVPPPSPPPPRFKPLTLPDRPVWVMPGTR